MPAWGVLTPVKTNLAFTEIKPSGREMMKTKRAYLNLLTIASILLSALAWSAAATGAATAETLGIIRYASRTHRRLPAAHGLTRAGCRLHSPQRQRG